MAEPKDLGKVSIVPKGTYDPLASYERLDVVYSNGSAYLAKTDNTGHAVTETAYWHKLVDKGAGIVSITKTSTSGGTDTYTITMDNGSTSTFTVTNGLTVKRTSVTFSAAWSGSGPYTQTVTVSGYTATPDTRVDLIGTDAAIARMQEDSVERLCIVNDNGTLTAYAYGNAPTQSFTADAYLYEIINNE